MIEPAVYAGQRELNWMRFCAPPPIEAAREHESSQNRRPLGFALAEVDRKAVLFGADLQVESFLSRHEEGRVDPRISGFRNAP